MTSAITCIAPLFVPATRPDRFAKAAVSGADAVIIDLEDAVAPADKSSARSALKTNLNLSVPMMIRINGVRTEWFKDDVECAIAAGVRCIMLPKAESREDVAKIKIMSVNVDVVAIIETAQGLANARDIAAGGAARLAFGSLDFSVDVNCALDAEVLAPVRSEIVLASRLARITPPLEGVTAEIDDHERLTVDARRACNFGFGGKMCIHPSQVASVLAAFTPSQSEIDWARSVLSKGDVGVLKVGGAVVDAPVILRAKQILLRMKQS